MARTMSSGGGILDTVKGLGRTALDYTKAHPGDVASGALAGLQGIQSAQSSARAGKYQKKGIDLAEGLWNERAPLRKKSLDELMNPTKPDLSSTYGDPSNPFSLQARPRPLASRVPL